MTLLRRLIGRLRSAWRSLWAGSEMSSGKAVPANPYLSQAPSSGDVDADSRGQGRISS